MEIPSPRSTRRARIEIIPLIDIIFFLLATFVIVSLSMIQNQGIAVRLPAAATATQQDRQDAASISIAESGQIWFDKEEVTVEQLAARLEARKTAEPGIRVFINGDENARLGLAIAALDIARRLGISQVAFQTKPASAPRP